jgi:hypothetical protein
MLYTHKELVDIAIKWLKRPYLNTLASGHYRCGTILSELSTIAGETPDVIGWNSHKSILIECKTSRRDFYAEAKKPWRSNRILGMGNLRYYMCEPGVIPIDKIPDGWGLLEISDRKVNVAKDAEYVKSNKNNEIVMLLSHIRRLTNQSPCRDKTGGG